MSIVDTLKRVIRRDERDEEERDRELEEAKRRKREVMDRLVNMGVEADVLGRRDQR